MRRALLLIGLTMGGAILGILGAFLQADRSVLDTAGAVLVLPWGAVLVLAVLAAVVRGAVWTARSRWGGWLCFLGWVAGTGMMGSPSPSGDLALASGGRQWAYLLIGIVIGAVCATLPARSSPTIEGTPRT